MTARNSTLNTALRGKPRTRNTPPLKKISSGKWCLVCRWPFTSPRYVSTSDGLVLIRSTFGYMEPNLFFISSGHTMRRVLNRLRRCTPSQTYTHFSRQTCWPFRYPLPPPCCAVMENGCIRSLFRLDLILPLGAFKISPPPPPPHYFKHLFQALFLHECRHVVTER